MATQIQLRNGTAAAWTAANPVMAVGEVGVETDTSKLKIGDGVTAWNSLTYATGGSGVTVQDEGVALATAGTTLNFVGAGVVATGTGAVKTVTIAGGTSTLAGASDYATATINTGNTPLANALAAKADALSAVVLGAGPTAITRAAHLNRPVSSAQAGATSITFAATATSGALAGDGFECLNTGAGTMTASGAITAATGYKLTALTGEVFSAVYNAATDSFYSTTPSAASSFTGGTLTSALNYAPIVTIATSATPAIFAAAANSISLTGAVTITGFDTIAAGAIRRVVFTGAPTITHNATSLILPSGASIVAAAGDTAVFESLGAGNTRCVAYTRASGAPLSSSKFKVYGLDANPTAIAAGAATNVQSGVITIPANVFPIKGMVRIRAVWSRTGSTDSPSPTVRISAGTGATFGLATIVASPGFVASTVRLVTETWLEGNRADRTTIQYSQDGDVATGKFVTGLSFNLALDTTAAWQIQFGGNAVTTDTYTCLFAIAEISDPDA